MFSKKIKFDILYIIIGVAYVMSFFGNFFAINLTTKNYNELYDKLLSESLEFNIHLKNETNVGNDNTVEEVPLFQDAKTAVISAWNKFKESSAYEIVGFGTGAGTSLGHSIHMAMQNTYCQWLDGTNYVEQARKQTENSIVGDVLSGSFLYYYVPGKNRVTFDSHDIKLNTDSLNVKYGDYSVSDYDYPYKSMIYIVNENSIVKQDFFKVNYNVYTGKIDSYSASVILNPNIACKDYMKNLKSEMGDVITHAPIFNNLKFNMVIDKTGYIKMLNIQEEYKFVYASMGNECITSSNIDYKFLSYNQDPTTIQKINI